jgi:hypothetical protein
MTLSKILINKWQNPNTRINKQIKKVEIEIKKNKCLERDSKPCNAYGEERVVLRDDPQSQI